MNVSITKIKIVKDNAYYLTLKPNSASKREKKVIRAIALALCKQHPLIGSGPRSLGPDACLYLKVIPIPEISEKEYKRALAKHKELPWNSANEIRQSLALERRLAEDEEYQQAQRSDSVAKRFGLHKIIPKSARALHTCRCGVTFKKKVKLLRHQMYCQVLASEQANFTHFDAVQKLVKKKGLDEGKSLSKSSVKYSRQQVSDKAKAANKRRQKTSKTSKR